MEIKAVVFERFPDRYNPDLPPDCKEVRLEAKIILNAHINMEQAMMKGGDQTEYAIQYLVDKFRYFFRWDQKIEVERKNQLEVDARYRREKKETLEHTKNMLEEVKKEIKEGQEKIQKKEINEGNPPDKGYSDVIEEDVGGVLSTSGKASGPPVYHPTDPHDR